MRVPHAITTVALMTSCITTEQAVTESHAPDSGKGTLSTANDSPSSRYLPDASSTDSDDVASSDASAGDVSLGDAGSSMPVETSSPPITSDTPSTSEPTGDAGHGATMEDVSTEPPLVVDGNLVPNSSFEEVVSTGLQPGQWQVMGNAASIPSTADSHTGTRSWQTAGRTQSWEGPAINLLGILEHGQTYVARAWVRASEASTFHIVTMSTCLLEGGVEEGGIAGEDSTQPYQQLAGAFSAGTEWVQLETAPFALRDCELTALVLYFDGPLPGVHLFVDDVSVVAVP